MIAVVDNYDSFTFNLVQYLWGLAPGNQVVRNDMHAKSFWMPDDDRVLIGLDPATRHGAGISLPPLVAAQRKLPLLGVCPGASIHYASFGARVVRANRLMCMAKRR